jgi:hypothetical protein
LTFNQGVPVVVYRNTELIDDPETFGRFLSHLNGGLPLLLSFSFDGSQLTKEQATETMNYLVNSRREKAAASTYSTNMDWNRETCLDLLDGMRRNLDSFDFTAPGVHVTRAMVIGKAAVVLSCLACAFLEDATAALNGVTPDGDDDFLSAGRLGQIQALFTSAIVKG